MSFHIYRSTDAGAPELWPQAGSLIALLDAVLVDGYGSGGSASAAAGWEIAYSGTDVRVYRGTDPAGTRYYYRVDDTDADGVALVRGYESMSDVDTGTVPFPTPAQNADGVDFGHDEFGTDGLPHAWAVIADGRSVVVAVANGLESGQEEARLYYFGELAPVNAQQPTDAVIGGSNASDTISSNNALVNLKTVEASETNYSLRAGAAWADQTVGGVATAWYLDDSTSSRIGGRGFVPGDGAISNLSDGIIAIPNFAVAASRIVGRLRGIYNAPHGLIDDEALIKELGNVNGRRAVGVPIFASGHCLFLGGDEP